MKLIKAMDKENSKKHRNLGERVNIWVPKGKKEKWEGFCQKQVNSLTLTNLIKTSVDFYIEQKGLEELDESNLSAIDEKLDNLKAEFISQIADLRVLLTINLKDQDIPAKITLVSEMILGFLRLNGIDGLILEDLSNNTRIEGKDILQAIKLLQTTNKIYLDQGDCKWKLVQ